MPCLAAAALAGLLWPTKPTGLNPADQMTDGGPANHPGNGFWALDLAQWVGQTHGHSNLAGPGHR